MYFSSDQVHTSFKRLASRKHKGKTHLERTSCLMYFFAFDAVSKKTNLSLLDLNPDKTEGKNNRKAIELEFTKLVLLQRSPQKIIQVTELGKIDRTGKHPEKRISSNFLTVPLKKATEQSEPYFYPKRPPTPMIKLGTAATGLKWGIELHQDWPDSLPKLLSEIKNPTPFTDLAIFVMRDTRLNDEAKDYIDALSTALNERFNPQLSKFWIQRIEKEKVMAHRHILTTPFSATHQAFTKSAPDYSDNRFESLSRDDLVNYIVHLEGTLETNQIKFTVLT